MKTTKFITSLFTIRRVRSVFPALPLLYFIARAYFISAETNAIYMEKDSVQEKIFSVAGIAENKPPADYMRITFYESARIYKLFKSLPDYKTYLGYLEEAKEKKLFVNVMLASTYSDTIMSVKRGKRKNE
jgi:hypothetical protein